MFNVTESHAEMIKPRAIRSVSDAKQYRSYEAGDESTDPRSIGAPRPPAMRAAMSNDETIPTSVDAPQSGASSMALTRVKDTRLRPERSLVEPGGGYSRRDSYDPLPADNGGPSPMAPYEPVVPGASPQFPPGDDSSLPGFDPSANGGAPMPGNGGGYMPAGVPVTNGALVANGVNNGGIESGYPGQAEGPLMPGGVPAGATGPIYMQPWFWGVAASLAGAGALYYYYGTKKRRA